MRMAMNTMYAIAATMAVTVGGAAHAQTATSASDYVSKAGAGDQYEIQSSKLVLSSSKNARLKGFANNMIKDHTKSTAMVKAAAMKGGMTPPPPMLDADGQSMISQLQGATGADRDKMYLQQQTAAHDKALALHQDYASNGDSAPLKAAAAKIVPVVQGHRAMLTSMPM